MRSLYLALLGLVLLTVAGCSGDDSGTGSGGKGGASGGSGGGAASGGSGGTGGTGGSSGGGTGGVAGADGGGTGGADAGACVDPANDCPAAANECVTPVCVAGACSVTNVADGTATTAGQLAGDCKKQVCDGAGATKVIDDDADPTDDSNTCTTDTCSAGVNVHTPVAAGTACSQNGGSVCASPTGSKAGTCVECNVDADCTTAGEVCDPKLGSNTCVPATCTDNAKNGSETDVDCGGSACASCPNTKACGAAADCQSGYCNANTCAACTSNTNCLTAQFCDLAANGGTCTADKSDGKACSASAECANGNCVDGVCCNSACAGTCDACSAAKKGQGVDGVCGPIATGSDPDDECTAAAASTCGQTGACGGSSNCALHSSGTVCLAAACAGGTATAASTCNGTGTCVAGGSTPCSPYACSGVACATSCTGDSQCATGNFCNGSNVCVAKLVSGAACSGASQCTSGFCVDGVCCSSACTGTCSACSAAKKGSGSNGTCGNIQANTDPDAECAADSAASCGQTGMCSGTGVCALYASNTVCAAASCTSGTATAASNCNGTGTCVAGGSTPCAPYVCAGTACGSSCTGDGDCAAGNYCNGSNACVSKLADGQSCSTSNQCTNGNCVDGVCCNLACAGLCEACTATKTGGTNGTCAKITGATDPDNECTGADACDGAGACASPPTVVSTTPANGATGADGLGNIVVTFSTAMSLASFTTKTTLDSGACSGSVQVSSDDFVTCVPLGVTGLTGGGTILTLDPSIDLPYGATFKIRVSTAAKSAIGLSLAAQFETASGFTTAVDVGPLDGKVIIAQVYGGGNNSGAAWQNDFVVLKNLGATAVSLTGWSLQYTSAAGTAWGSNKLALSGSIAAGGYFLVSLAGGTTNGAALPAADQSGTINMSGADGKIALVSSTTSLPALACPSDPSIMDLVGYGSANCFEGAAAVGTLSVTTWATRAGSGCTDTNQNGTNFSVAGSPAPYNSASSRFYCSGPDVWNESNLAATNNGELHYCVVQFPTSLGPVSTGSALPTVYGQVYKPGITDSAGNQASIVAQLGIGPRLANPETVPGSFTWTAATFNNQQANNYEYQASGVTAPGSAGQYSYVYRMSLDSGATWTYCDVDGAGWNAGLSFEVTRIPLLTVQ